MAMQGIKTVESKASVETGPLSSGIPRASDVNKKFYSLVAEIESASASYTWCGGRKFTLASTGEKRYSLKQLRSLATDALKAVRTADIHYQAQVGKFRFTPEVFPYMGNTPFFRYGLPDEYIVKDFEDVFEICKEQLTTDPIKDVHAQQVNRIVTSITKLDHDSDATVLKKCSLIFRIYLFFFRLLSNGPCYSHKEVCRSLEKLQSGLHTGLGSAYQDLRDIVHKNCLSWLASLSKTLPQKQKAIAAELKHIRQLRDAEFDQEAAAKVMLIDAHGVIYMPTEKELSSWFDAFMEKKEAYKESVSRLLSEQRRVAKLYAEVVQLSKEVPQSSAEDLGVDVQERRSLSYFIDSSSVKKEQKDLYESLEDAFNTEKFEKAFNLPEDWTQPQLRAAFKKVCFATHPDRHKGLDGFFKAFNYAYDRLSNL